MRPTLVILLIVLITVSCVESNHEEDNNKQWIISKLKKLWSNAANLVRNLRGHDQNQLQVKSISNKTDGIDSKKSNKSQQQIIKQVQKNQTQRCINETLRIGRTKFIAQFQENQIRQNQTVQISRISVNQTQCQASYTVKNFTVRIVGICKGNQVTILSYVFEKKQTLVNSKNESTNLTANLSIKATTIQMNNSINLANPALEPKANGTQINTTNTTNTSINSSIINIASIAKESLSISPATSAVIGNYLNATVGDLASGTVIVVPLAGEITETSVGQTLISGPTSVPITPSTIESMSGSLSTASPTP